MEFVKQLFFSQLIVLLDSSLIAQEDVKLAQQDAEHVQVPQSVHHALPTDSQSKTTHALPFVGMDWLLLTNHAMIEIKYPETDVQILVELKHSLSVVVSHQFALTMAQLFVEMVD